MPEGEIEDENEPCLHMSFRLREDGMVGHARTFTSETMNRNKDGGSFQPHIPPSR